MDFEKYLHKRGTDGKQKQRAFGEISLGMDFDMNELQPESSQRESARRQYSKSPEKEDNDNENEFLRSNSSASDVRESQFLRERKKSRFSERTPGEEKGNPFSDDDWCTDSDEEDQLFDEDLPKEEKDPLTIWVLPQWLGAILMIASLICSFGYPGYPCLTNLNPGEIRLRQLIVGASVPIGGRLVSRWIFKIIMFFIKRNFLLRKRISYFLLGLREQICNFLWLGVVLVVWQYYLYKNVSSKAEKRTLGIVTRGFVCLLLSMLFWVGKSLLVAVLSSHFHISTYFYKILDALSNLYVIQVLSGPPLAMIQKLEEEERIANEVRNIHAEVGFIGKIAKNLSMEVILSKCGIFLGSHVGKTIPPAVRVSPHLSSMSSRVIGSGRRQRHRSSRLLYEGENEGQGISVNLLHKLTPKSVSAWIMERMMNIIRSSSLSTWNESIEITSEFKAKVAATTMFQNVAEPGSRDMNLKDILRFMQKDEAARTMSLIKGEYESRSIKKSALKIWMINAFKEWQALALVLNDMKKAVNNLHQMVNTLVSIIILLMWVVILGIASIESLQNYTTLIAAAPLALSFIFSDSLKETFEGIIFIFFMHPFDSGDHCQIDEDKVIVEEMHILKTVFKTYKESKLIISNKVLTTAKITNNSCTPDMGDEVVKFNVHNSISREKITMIRKKISSYVEDKNEHWHSAPMFKCKDLEDLNWVRIKVLLTHKGNHQSTKEKRERRELLMDEINRILKEIDIKQCWEFA